VRRRHRLAELDVACTNLGDNQPPAACRVITPVSELRLGALISRARRLSRRSDVVTGAQASSRKRNARQVFRDYLVILLTADNVVPIGKRA
jgi:hypothetical protein